MQEKIQVAIVGAEGLIGETLLSAIAEHPLLTGYLHLLGGEQSVGQSLEFGRQELVVADISIFDFNQAQVVICTGDEQPDPEWLERAREAGCILLDIGAHLLEVYDLPPVVGAVNPEILAEVAQGGIVALPDAATTQLVSILKPLVDNLEIHQVSVVSCQAVSDKGRSGVEEMARQTAQLLNAKPVTPLLFPQQIAFNLLSQIGELDEHGCAAAENKIIRDAESILGLTDLRLSVTCLWAPVFFGHTQVIGFQTLEPADVGELEKKLAKNHEILLFKASDSPPTAVTDASGKNRLTVGRLRSVSKNSTEFSLLAVADNLQFGIAGNAVKILEVLVKDYL